MISNQHPRLLGSKAKYRRGATAILMVFSTVMLFGMLLFVVEMGRMFIVKSEIQNAADAGAMAGLVKLQQDFEDINAAVAEAERFVQLNQVGVGVLVPQDAITVESGQWDAETEVFTSTSVTPNAVRVSALQNDEPFLFARLFGNTSFGSPASAIAASTSKLDIMMVLDLSGSMEHQGRIEALQNAAPAFAQAIEDAGGDDMIGVMGLSANPDTYDPVDEGHTGVLYTPAGLNPDPSYHVGVLESALTNDFASLRSSALSSSNLFHSKYGGATGTGAAIRDSAHYLVNAWESRAEADKVIVLMSDGYATIPDGNGSGYATSMASYAIGLDVKIWTVSLGNDADIALMQSIANLTDGKHFDATGSSEAVLTEKLTQAYKDIAAELKRPQLVQ